MSTVERDRSTCAAAARIRDEKDRRTDTRTDTRTDRTSEDKGGQTAANGGAIENRPENNLERIGR